MWVSNRAAALSAYGPISGWVVSSITDMRYLFYELANFDEDVSSWDTSSVTTMHGMFQVRNTLAPVPPPPVSPSTCLGVTRQQASAFNQPLSFDTSSVTTMYLMFYVRSAPCRASDLQ